MKLSVVYSLKTAGYGAWFLVVSRGVRPAITYTQREATPRTTVTDGGRYAALTPCDAGQTGEAERLCFAAVFFTRRAGPHLEFEKEHLYPYGRKTENHPPWRSERDRQEHDRL